MVTVRARELEFAYPDEPPVVAGFSLELKPGELTCLFGPNGAGKSTLLRLLAGLLRPRAGRVELADGDLHARPPKERAREVALVPQGLSTLPQVRVFDFVFGGRYCHQTTFGRPSPADAQAVRAALEACSVSELGARLLTELSGGQLQRVLIARALAQESAALLVDEPTSSLDPAHQLAVFEILRTLAHEGRTVLVVTHDLNLASQFADRAAVLAAGRLHAEGTPEEVLREEILRPVYGGCLLYGELGEASDRRRVVLPWRER